MDFSKIISKNFLCSGVPVQTATVGIQALDVSTGTLYIQNRIPNGASWVVKSKNYFQPTSKTTEVEIDFGDTCYQTSGVFNIVDASVTTSSKPVVSKSIKSPSDGRDIDEIFAQQLELSAKANNGSIDIYVNSLCGSLNDKFIINYTI